jgi:hypothetical protein
MQHTEPSRTTQIASKVETPVKIKLKFRRMLRISLLQCFASFSFLSPMLVLSAGGAARAQEAQAAAIWQGVLRDPGGAPIAGAKVKLAADGKQAEAITAADGQFHLAPLPAGAYHLTVKASGHTVDYAQPIDLIQAAPSVVVTLSNRGELTVAQFKGQAATGGEQLSSQAVSELPLNKRDFSSLLLLAAGTMTDANGATNFTAAVRHQRPARS